MRKLIAASSIGAITGFAIILANTPVSPVSADINSSGGYSRSEEQVANLGKATKVTRNSESCVDTHGVVFHQSDTGFDRCVKQVQDSLRPPKPGRSARVDAGPSDEEANDS